MFCDTKLRAKQCLGCSCSKRHDHLRFDYCDLGFEPGPTRIDLLHIRFFVNASFTSWFPLEMFDNIGDVSLLAIDSGFLERTIKHSSSRSHKRFACQIFFVAWLFSAEKSYCSTLALSENGLRALFPKVTPFAISRRRFERGQR